MPFTALPRRSPTCSRHQLREMTMVPSTKYLTSRCFAFVELAESFWQKRNVSEDHMEQEEPCLRLPRGDDLGNASRILHGSTMMTRKMGIIYPPLILNSPPLRTLPQSPLAPTHEDPDALLLLTMHRRSCKSRLPPQILTNNTTSKSRSAHVQPLRLLRVPRSIRPPALKL